MPLLTSHAADWGDEPATLYEWRVVENVLFGMLADSLDERQLMCLLDALRDKVEALHDENGEVSRRLLIATVVFHMKHVGDYDGPACW